MRDFSIATFDNSQTPKKSSDASFNLTYGLFVITSKFGDKDNGHIANTAFQVANDPERIAVSVQKGNYNREIIEQSGVFNVCILSEEVDFDTIKHFGMQSGRDVDKFETVDCKKRSNNGIYYLTEKCNAYLSCKVTESRDLGSHVLFIGEVAEKEVLSAKPSCTYAYYHKAIKKRS